MAEARSAVSYRDATSNLSFVVTEDEIVLRISKDVVPTFLTSIRRSVARRLLRARNILLNTLYPQPPWQAAVAVAGPAAILLSDIPQLRSAHDYLWSFDRFIPSASWMPHIGRVGRAVIISTTVGTGALLALSYFRNFCMRLLLSYQGWLYESRPTTTTLIWGFLVRLLSGQHPYHLVAPRPLMYANQKALPTLPVPDLNETCNRFMRSVKPVLGEAEYAEMEKICNEFRKNEGRRLQRYCHLKSLVSSNYVADWWESYVYLHGRDPIVINSNYYILDSKGQPRTHRQAARAAVMMYECIKVKRRLEAEQIEPMTIRSTVPLCMAQYERVFSTTRIPGIETDTLKHYEDSRHVVVLRKGRFYTLDAITPSGSQLLAAELEAQLTWILNDADRSAAPTVAEESIPALTCQNRTEWARTRSEIFTPGSLNKASLDKIEKAIFFVSLDDNENELDWNGMARSIFHGNGKNRWVDKSVSIVVFPNARIGLHVEHSWADAPVISHVFEFCLQINEPRGLGYDEDGHCRLPPGVAPRAFEPPRRLQWDLSSGAEQSISTALEFVGKLIDDVDQKVVVFDEYGKGFMKKCRVSPDAFIQLALQLAYFKDTNGFAMTYESSMTRLFLHGRTETVRPVTIESAEFVRKFYDASVSKEDKIKLLQEAGNVHQTGYRDAMTGKGVDRHLFALYVIARGLNVSSPFLKTALSLPWKLSTSQQPQNQTGLVDTKKHPELLSHGGGFGPVTDTGYGISYMVASEDDLSFHVSSKVSCPETDSERMGERIKEALREMRQLFE